MRSLKEIKKKKGEKSFSEVAEEIVSEMDAAAETVVEETEETEEAKKTENAAKVSKESSEEAENAEVELEKGGDSEADSSEKSEVECDEVKVTKSETEKSESQDTKKEEVDETEAAPEETSESAEGKSEDVGKTEETNENGEAEDRAKKGFFRSLGKAHIIILSCIGVLVAAVLIFVLALSARVYCEAGERPDYSKITENAFIGRLCKVESDLDSIDTLTLGKVKVDIKFFGFLKTRSTLIIRDTVCPEVTTANVVITSDVEVTGEMFVKSFTDATKVDFSVMPVCDQWEVGEHEVTVYAKDEGGNIVISFKTLTVIEPTTENVFEVGASDDALKNHFLSLFPDASETDFSEVSGCGEFTVKGSNASSAFFTQIFITDTKPPVAEVRSLDILLGDTVSLEDVVTNVEDHSEVTVSFENMPDFKSAGEFEVKAILTDAFGNGSEYVFYIRIHDIETDITAEFGSSNAELAALIFKDDFSRNALFFESDRVMDHMTLGENSLELSGEYGAVTVKVNLIDTVAPVLNVHSENYPVGRTPKVSDFVLSFADASEVTFAFKTVPDSSVDGTFDVTIIATDTSGNSTEATTKVIFYYDFDAPVISGYCNYSLIAGEKCDFSVGVSAYDAICGVVKVQTDASAVNLNAPGQYVVVYTATDESGNVAKEEISVTVREPVRVCLNVSCLMQRPALPNGCEATSLAMVLGYNGYRVSHVDLFENFMNKSPFKEGDPWTSYVGNPYVKGEGYGCFAPCVVETGNKYLDSVGSSKRVCDVSGMGLSYYESLIDQGIPVLLWGTTKMSGRDKICWEAEIDGKSVCWLSSSHCLVLIGYTDYTYIFCDPLEGLVEYDRADVERSYNLNFRQACVIK